MEAALAVTRLIDGLNRRVAVVAAYLVLFASLVSAFNALFRYSTNSLIWLDRTVGAGGAFAGALNLNREN